MNNWQCDFCGNPEVIFVPRIGLQFYHLCSKCTTEMFKSINCTEKIALLKRYRKSETFPMQKNENKSNNSAIQNAIGQLRIQIKLMNDDEQLSTEALTKLDELENLFKEKEDKCVR